MIYSNLADCTKISVYNQQNWIVFNYEIEQNHIKKVILNHPLLSAAQIRF